MIDLYYWPTPNGHKITMFLEEAGLEYRIVPVEHRQGRPVQAGIPGDLAEQPDAGDRRPRARRRRRADRRCSSRARSCSISPRRPAGSFRSDLRGRARGAAVAVLADGRPRADGRTEPPLLASTRRRRSPTPSTATCNETNRLYGVLDRRLADRAFVAGEYSIADMAIYPWIVPHERQGQNLEDFPQLKRWFEAIRARPATVRAYEKGKEVNSQFDAPMSEAAKKILFGQTAAVLDR